MRVVDQSERLTAQRGQPIEFSFDGLCAGGMSLLRALECFLLFEDLSGRSGFPLLTAGHFRALSHRSHYRMRVLFRESSVSR